MSIAEEAHKAFHAALHAKMKERSQRMSEVVRKFYGDNMPNVTDLEMKSMEGAVCAILSIIRLVGTDDNHQNLSMACRCVLACMIHIMQAASEDVTNERAVECARFVEATLDTVDDLVEQIDVELGLRQPDDEEQQRHDS